MGDLVDTRKQGNPTGHNVIFVGVANDGSSLQSLVKPVQFEPQVPQRDYYEQGVDGINIYCFFPDQSL